MLRIPALMAREHEELHADLAAAAASGGSTGAAAARVEQVLAPHFDEENRFALPPLGLLPHLVDGQVVNRIAVDADTATWARVALERMLEIV